MSKSIIKLEKINKTAMGLRDALFDEINGLRTGTTTIHKANTVHKLATQIIILTKTELENSFKLAELSKSGDKILGTKK